VCVCVCMYVCMYVFEAQVNSQLVLVDKWVDVLLNVSRLIC
jgi:hypothetical protein